MQLDGQYQAGATNPRLTEPPPQRAISGPQGAQGAHGVPSVEIASDIPSGVDEFADVADRYRLLIELSPEAICVHDGSYLKYANPSMLRIMAASSENELVGRPIGDLVDPGSMSGVYHRIDSLKADGATSDPAEALLKRLDGATILVESVAVRTRWEGKPAYQVIMRDVTVQKAAEAALHYRAALVEHVSDAIIATDGAGVVTSWNPAAETVYGYRAQDAIGRPVSDLAGAPLDPKEVLRSGGVIAARHHHADGRLLAIRVSAAQMADGYVLVCADETARRRAEQHFSTVVAALDEGVLVIGADGRVESINPAGQEILGTTTQSIVGASMAKLDLFDESGAAIPLGANPILRTQRTGTPRTGLVIRVRRPDQRDVWISLTCRLLDPADRSSPSVIMSFTDITERRAIAAQLAHDATHDPLTGLANRTLVIERLTAALRTRGRVNTTAVLFIDLDKFKVINDSLGHSVGDQVLRIASERLSNQISGDNLIGRLGGDEFVAVNHDINDLHEVSELAQSLRDSLAEPITIDGRQLHLDASIGIVIAPPGDTRDAEDLIRDADVAMYQAKTLGRGRYEFFDVGLRMRLQRRLRLEQDLREALPQDQLWVAYQPVVDLRTGHMVAVEGLLRWNHPEHGVISPTEFIPLAEESDLINLIGGFTLREATRELAARRVEHGVDTHLKVNLSTRQLDDPRLVSAVRAALAESGLPPQTLCLEITESVLMRDSESATNVLDAFRRLGVCLAIDDFGTGYSSLAQLQRLTLDTLKIDRSFITGLGRNSDAEAIITSIIAMAHAVDLTVIAEGVENERQIDILRRLGCDQGQGFYFGRPVKAAELFASRS